MTTSAPGRDWFDGYRRVYSPERTLSATRLQAAERPVIEALRRVDEDGRRLPVVAIRCCPKGTWFRVAPEHAEEIWALAGTLV